MTATKTMTTKTGKPLVTSSIIKKWIHALDSGKYPMTQGKRGIHLLTCVSPGGKLADGTIAKKETWEWDVFGLLADYVADIWQKDRDSSVHQGVTYYVPMRKIGGKLTMLTPDLLGLNPTVFQRLYTLHMKGASAEKMADFIETFDGHLVGSES